VAPDLLGCVLVSRRGGAITAGRIVETEAYLGPEDLASHAAFRPGSHALFYGEGGHAYVFVNYGVHYCLNAITNPAGEPGCVLIRALEPLTGVAAMQRRRGVAAGARLASGPGNLTRALAITLRDNGTDLTRGPLVILRPDRPRDFRVERGTRIGITRSAELPLRFWIAGHPSVSGRASARATAPRASARGLGRRGRARPTR
jgi:DNA-3-methyladenine glycosylase